MSPKAILHRKRADILNIGLCRRMALSLTKMDGLEWLTLRWRSFLGHRYDVAKNIFAQIDGR